MSRDPVHDRIAGRFQSRFLQHYARSKLSNDPLYAAIEQRLRGSDLPLVDIGCGIGLMEIYLRERGYSAEINGLDTDERKIAVARSAALPCADVHFDIGDAREAPTAGKSVLLLDLLHYLTTDEQERLLTTVAAGVPAGGLAIVRDAVRDGSWRYRMTKAQESFSRLIRWSRVERLNFPTRDDIVEPFRRRGYEVEVTPLWARTPFNNYLFVFRRSGSGMTNV